MSVDDVLMFEPLLQESDQVEAREVHDALQRLAMGGDGAEEQLWTFAPAAMAVHNNALNGSSTRNSERPAVATSSASRVSSGVPESEAAAQTTGDSGNKKRKTHKTRTTYSARKVAIAVCLGM